ncbi:MAG TPA: hypothetical protein VKZ65_14660 [Glycomyces sp.]|nr:hypothetical protein [Glycomyces sp.]
MHIRETIQGATGFARSAAIATGNRLQALTSHLTDRIVPWMTVLAGLLSAFTGILRSGAAVALERIQPLMARVAEFCEPGVSRLAEHLRPWAALAQDTAAVAADAAGRALDVAVEFARPLVNRLTERFGVRMTVVGAASAIFVGSTGGTAWAITAMDAPGDPVTEQVANTTAESIAALSEDASVTFEELTAAEQEALAAAEAEAEEAAKAEPADPEPVGGLNGDQMDNAVAIIEAGQDEGLDRDGWAVALATAMQESKFKNYANEGLPESFDYDYQAVGSDHDSVGLFQQRPASGWGSVEELMDPKTSASKFYKALKNVDGWEDMPVTVAAQTVQVSAFPDHYAQWEDLAWDIIESYEDAQS